MDQILLSLIDCGVAKASKLIRRLEGEGLVSKPNSQARNYSYTVHKSPEAKEKIRYFFGSDLSVFPELREFFNGESRKLGKRVDSNKGNKSSMKRRRSETLARITCEC